MKRDIQLIKGVIGTIQCAPLLGVKAKFIRQSKRTGGLTVEVLETTGAYARGTFIHISRCDFILLCEKE